MAIYSFDGADLKMMLLGAVDLLGQSKGEIDALNVFPVPDGDTGTNMYHTLVAAVDEAVRADTNHIGLVAEAAARGGLTGARGNSGVILSQILHGFACSLRENEKASAADIARALESGAQTAYRAVMSPVEGTILTVVRKSAEEAAARRSGDLLRLMVGVLRKAFTALEETPEHLPVLKQAGVVDAGGKGFVTILEGILRSLKAASPGAKTARVVTFRLPRENSQEKKPALRESAINFTYCTELLVKGDNLPLESIKLELTPLGDCLMVVGNEGLAKVHIHSNHPGLVLESCLKYGSLHDLKINNMLEQNMDMLSGGQELLDRPYGIVSIAAGAGLTEIMKNLGADTVVAGGQTLNPSTEDILKAAERIPADRIIVLPNNKNIILAAEQAGKLSRKNLIVIPTKSIPQGIAALLTLNPEDDAESAAGKMYNSLETVRTGEVTRAVRDTAYKDLEVRQGDYIGLADGDLTASGSSLTAVLENLLEDLIEGEGRMITLYYGSSVEEKVAETLAAGLRERFSEHDFEVQYGGQPVYDLIISVE